MPSLHIDPPKKSLSQMKHLTRKVSSVDEFYEGKSIAIPFTWESQPGTPKVKFREAHLPPLTPPPSYYYKPASNRPIKHPKQNFLNTIFPKRNTRKVRSSSCSSSSSPTSSFSLSPPSSPLTPSRSSYSVPSSPMTPSRFCRRGTGRISSPRLSYDCRAGDEEDHEYKESSISTLCFGISPRWSKIIGSKAIIRV